METGIFEKEVHDAKILDLVKRIASDGSCQRVCRICEQYGEAEDECREYDTYRIVSASGSKMLKKADSREAANYEAYLSRGDFMVPRFYGRVNDGPDIWIALENIEGSDIRDMTDELAKAAAKSLSQIQNHFWGNPDTERFDRYLERIEKRFQYIKDAPDIGAAYKVFLERQKDCPRTLSNGDLLQCNAVGKDGAVYIIDWGFGGVMPYSLDIARFIAHATEDRATFPFRMSDRQKQIFLDEVYENLAEKPDRGQFIWDVKLAVLNEYVEFMEADEDESGWYRHHAGALAREILKAKAAEQR